MQKNRFDNTLDKIIDWFESRQIDIDIVWGSDKWPAELGMGRNWYDDLTGFFEDCEWFLETKKVKTLIISSAYLEHDEEEDASYFNIDYGFSLERWSGEGKNMDLDGE